MRFSTGLELPRSSLPRSWVADHEPSFNARGLLLYLSAALAPGITLTDADLEKRRHARDLPLRMMVGELVQYGYLRSVDDGRSEVHYKLVHPDRLPALPQLETHR